MPTYTDFLVPTSIDATGATDVSAALNGWVAGVPNGASSTAHSRLIFPAGGTYKMASGGLQMGGRSHMTLQGGTIANRCKLTSPLASGFAQLQGNILIGRVYGSFSTPCTDIVVSDFYLEQFHPTPGILNVPSQACSAITVIGGSNTQILDIFAKGINSDGIQVAAAASNVYVSGATIADCGRNGVSVISGDHVTVENCDFQDVGYYTLDLEPNDATSGTGSDVTYVTFRNNRFGSWGPDVGAGQGFMAAGDGPFRTMSDIVIDGNVGYGTRNSESPTPGVGGHSTLRAYIGMGQSTRIQRVTFTNNTAAVSDTLTAYTTAVLEFNAIDGLNVYGNTQPLSAGQPLSSITNSTGVVTASPVAPPVVSPDTAKLATAKDKARAILAITGSGKFAQACVYAQQIVDL